MSGAAPSLAKNLFLRGRKALLQTVCVRCYTNRNIWSLKERGLISSLFPKEEEKAFVTLCSGKPQTIYAGFDPTADSLHVGNLAVLMMLLNCQRAGHHVIALIGGATGLIGDPSGKTSERPEMESDAIQNNVTMIEANLKTLFENHEKYFWDSKNGKQPLANPLIVNNLDWYKKMNALEFVGKIGRHFRLGIMLMKENVKVRLASDEGMSFTEFTYQIFQAYDWYHLLRHYNCHIQVGGHDQMGNIFAGHELISRTLRKRVFGLTVPLVTTETGNKYGKTAGNAVWLDSQKTTTYDFYQFFIRTKDSDLERLFKLFTFRGEDEIRALIKRHSERPEARLAQTELAKDVTMLVHGQEGLDLAMKTSQILYSDDVEALSSLQAEDLQKLFKKGGPSYLSELFLNPGTTVLDMAMKAGCFDSPKDAIRIINAGGFSLNYRKVSNHEEVIVPGLHILPNKISLARVGKKNYYVIKWCP